MRSGSSQVGCEGVRVDDLVAANPLKESPPPGIVADVRAWLLAARIVQ